MRCLALAMFVAAILAGCQTISDLPPEQQHVEEVHVIEGKDKVALYSRALEWFGVTFRSAKAVLDVQDKDAGLIIAKGIIPNGAADGLGVRHDLRMTIKVEVKDGKYRTTYEPFVIIFGSSGEREAGVGTEHDSAMKTARDLDAQLAAFMGGKAKDF